MITIYHNPRCSKSHECLQLLELEQIPFTTVKYLNEPLSSKEITEIISKLAIRPLDLVRQKESVWVAQYKNRKLTDQQIVEALAQHPVLIQRPIVINGDKAVIARPAARVREIL